MALLPVKNLTQLGIVTDIAPFELPPNAWTEGNNISFEQGAVVKSSSITEVLKPSSEDVVKMYPKNKKIYYMTNTKAFLYDGASHINITRESGNYIGGVDWHISELSNVLIFSNYANIPQYISPTTNKLADLPDWNNQWRASVIRPYKNFLVALNMLENGLDFNQRVRWSDLTPPNAPPASWDATSTTNSAGFNDLSEARGKLVDGLDLGDSFIIYTEEEVFAMDYVAGNDIFRFRKILDKVSILAPECVAKVQGGHFVITKDDVIIHNGNSHQSIATDKIKNFLFEAIKNGNYNYVKVQANPSNNEIMILYPQVNSKVLTKAAIYNTTNNTWSFKDIPNAYAIAYGTLPDSNVKIIDSQTQVVDTDKSVIDGVGKDFIKSSLFVASSDLKFYALNEGQLVNGRIVPSYVAKSYIDFDETGIASDAIKQVKSIHPQITGQGSINIYVGYSMSPQESPIWSRPVAFNIGRDYKADFRVDGRYISIKFESLDNSFWKLTGYSLEVNQRGNR